MKAMTRTTQTATNALVAVIVAVLALFAVPTRVTAATPALTTTFSAPANAAGPIARSAPPRKLRVPHATLIAEPHVPPALPTTALLFVVSLVLLGVLRPVVQRLHPVTAFRLPGVRAPPLRFTAL